MKDQGELFTSEWGVRNDVKHLVEALQDKLPAMGMVKNANKNRCLEKFRKAQNVTYDIFNNGLINRGKSLKVLGLKKDDLPLPFYYGTDGYFPGNWDRVEFLVSEAFAPIVRAAAIEQGMIRG
tara:strand:- start:47 stop:415 length:369 start_codon:yes stop_codon:yes gene_type:complete